MLRQHHHLCVLQRRQATWSRTEGVNSRKEKSKPYLCVLTVLMGVCCCLLQIVPQLLVCGVQEIAWRSVRKHNQLRRSPVNITMNITTTQTEMRGSKCIAFYP